MLKNTKIKFLVLIALIYTAITIAFTWPLVLKPSTSIYGYSGDSFGAIHYVWWWKYALKNNLPFYDSVMEEAPFGVQFDQESGAIAYFLPIKALTYITNPVFAYNFLLFISFPLAGLTMFLLAYEVTKSRAASFWAGLVFTFSPYHFWKSYNHLDLSTIFTLPLFVLALLKLDESLKDEFVLRFKPLYKNKILLWMAISGGLLALTGWINLYYAYFLGLFTALFFLVKEIPNLIKPRLRKTFLRTILYGSVITVAIILLIPFNLSIIKDSFSPSRQTSPTRQETYDRPLLNLVSLSARPWDYFIPSPDHPIFGKYNESFYKWIHAQSSNPIWFGAEPHERTVFFGYTTTTLLLFTMTLLFRKKIPSVNQISLIRHIGLVALGLAFVSLPPYIYFKGVEVPLATTFLHKILPMFRTYARLGIFVQLCAILIATVCLSFLIKKTSYKKRFITIFLFCAFSLFEFLNIPPLRVTDFSTLPPEYRWLKEQAKETIVIHYPKSFSVADELLMQTFHEHAFTNFHVQSYYYDLWNSIEYFDIDYRAAEKLAALGIDYAFIHKKLLFDKPNLIDSLWYTRALPEKSSFDPQKLMPGFKLEKDFEKTTILKIDVPGPPIMAVFTKKASGLTQDWPTGRSLAFGKRENRIYLENLVEKANPRELKILLKFDGIGIDKMTFNGEALDVEKEEHQLTLKPFENIINIEGIGVVSVKNIQITPLE